MIILTVAAVVVAWSALVAVITALSVWARQRRALGRLLETAKESVHPLTLDVGAARGWGLNPGEDAHFDEWEREYADDVIRRTLAGEDESA